MKASNAMEDCFIGTATVGERGQVVIPAEARKKLDIGAGDKLLLMSHPSGQGLVLFKVDAVRELLNQLAAKLSVAEGIAESPDGKSECED